nr:hypothetical protein 2 [Pseudomonadaceae bacterium]
MDDLKIRRKCEDMIAYGYGVLKQFPKAERHVLSQEIRTTMWALLRLIIVCNRRYFKKTTMQDLDAELDLLRGQIRIAQKLGFLPFKNYEVWSRHLDEIGRMVGGWFKSLNEKGRG